MMRFQKGLFLVSLAALACSGRYEVGEMDPAGGGATAFAGSAGSSRAGEGTAAGSPNGGSASGGSGSTDCFTAVAPEPLNAPFVDPQSVWRRIAPFIWWNEIPVEKPGLPSELSYEGVGELVDDTFAEVMAESGGVPGGNYFVRWWLGLDTSETTLEGDYATSLAADDTTLLEALLLTSWAPDRTGAFTEQAWLAKNPTIPRRGSEIAHNLFGMWLPPPPPSIDQSVDPSLQDRAAIEAATSSAACASCHQAFMPLGYSLGHFDRAGDYRERDHDLPIDASGSFLLPNGDGVLSFEDIGDLGAKSATTCAANLAIVDSFLDVALRISGQDQENRYETIKVHRDRVRRAFIAGGRTYHALIRAFAQSPLVLY